MVQPSNGTAREEDRKQAHTPDCPDRHATGTTAAASVVFTPLYYNAMRARRNANCPQNAEHANSRYERL